MNTQDGWYERSKPSENELFVEIRKQFFLKAWNEEDRLA